jgi:hypothetical protein
VIADEEQRPRASELRVEMGRSESEGAIETGDPVFGSPERNQGLSLLRQQVGRWSKTRDGVVDQGDGRLVLAELHAGQGRVGIGVAQHGIEGDGATEMGEGGLVVALGAEQCAMRVVKPGMIGVKRQRIGGHHEPVGEPLRAVLRARELDRRGRARGIERVGGPIGVDRTVDIAGCAIGVAEIGVERRLVRREGDGALQQADCPRRVTEGADMHREVVEDARVAGAFA